jgi:hypothetical protein
VDEEMKSLKLKKPVLAIISLLSLSGILIDVYANFLKGGIVASISIFKYFTLQSNFFVFVFSFLALCDFRFVTDKPDFKKLLSPITSYIFLTGITYLIILAPTSHAVGLQKTASILLHYIVPPLMFLYWLFFEDRKLKYNDIWTWMIYPFLFMLWGLGLAIIKGDYLYPFFDISKLGVLVVPYLMAMALAFASIGLLLVFLNRSVKLVDSKSAS